MGYLKCEKCGGYYELQKGESPDDFQDKCECGGNLNYVESLDMNKPDETPKNASKNKDNLQDKKGPKPKRKKYLLIGLVVAVFIVAVIGGYYAYGQYQDNKYYENYRLSVYNGQQSDQKINQSNNVLSGYNFNTMTIAQFNQQYDEIIGKIDQGINNIDEAIDYEQKAKNYQKDMLNSARTDYQKKYAELLIKQNDLFMKRHDLYKQQYNLLKDLFAAAKNNDQNKVTEINKQISENKKQIETITNDINNLVNEREDIRVANPDFTTRLKKEAETATNATLI